MSDPEEQKMVMVLEFYGVEVRRCTSKAQAARLTARTTRLAPPNGTTCASQLLFAVLPEWRRHSADGPEEALHVGWAAPPEKHGQKTPCPRRVLDGRVLEEHGRPVLRCVSGVVSPPKSQNFVAVYNK